MSLTYLITGAGRGIGMSFVKALLACDTTMLIFAGVRNIATATELRTIAQSDKRVIVIPLDMDDDGSIQNAARIVSSRAKSLSVLINNAGFTPETMSPAAYVPPGDFIQAFKTNTLGPILLIQSFLPLLERAGGLVINISSILASMEMNPGRQVAYSVSKAGLNMATTIFQKQVKDNIVKFIAVHPGVVTKEVRPDPRQPQAPYITSDQSAQGILQNIVFSASVASMCGRFVSWDGKNIPW
ncbi:NADP-binding protein [Dacryopinax primogenitus]|uniref:NADP-binding protein n=1 Tax=Dacryopinax primogenitus (strain DJM 731) TaxID=1858805 RepID=M5FTH8_DACPD|nr:NADP-binding protein [Dacryopinax primogenitus]EJT96551.1 NADP-binding protein [Dacryopinax primogenitus]